MKPSKVLISVPVNNGVTSRYISTICKSGVKKTANEWYELLGESNFKAALVSGILVEMDLNAVTPSLVPGTRPASAPKVDPNQAVNNKLSQRGSFIMGKTDKAPSSKKIVKYYRGPDGKLYRQEGEGDLSNQKWGQATAVDKIIDSEFEPLNGTGAEGTVTMEDMQVNILLGAGLATADIDSVLLEELFNERGEYNHEAHKRWRAKNKDKVKAQNDRHRERHPEQGSARQAAFTAKKKGKLKKPSTCKRCKKKTKKLEFHHAHGYGKKGDGGGAKIKGKWLCRKCHMNIEKRHKISKAMKEEVLQGMVMWYANDVAAKYGGSIDSWMRPAFDFIVETADYHCMITENFNPHPDYEKFILGTL